MAMVGWVYLVMTMVGWMYLVMSMVGCVGVVNHGYGWLVGFS